MEENPENPGGDPPGRPDAAGHLEDGGALHQAAEEQGGSSWSAEGRENAAEGQGDGEEGDEEDEDEEEWSPVLRGAPEDTAAGALAREWSGMRHADARLVCAGGDAVRAHRLALAALSPVLEEAMLSVAAQEEEECLVLLAPDADADHLRIFLSGAYNGGDQEASVADDLRHLGFSEKLVRADKRRWKRKRKAAAAAKAYYEVPLTVDVKQEVFDDMDQPFHSDYDKAEEDAPATGRGSAGRRKAVVWRYFRRLDGDTSRCARCGSAVRTKHGNTTGLIQHLRHNHPEEYGRWQRERSRQLEERDAWKEEPPEPPSWFSNTEEVESRTSVPAGRSNRSVVWELFRRLDGVTMECIKCLKIITLSQGSTTSGCLNHLKRFHPETLLLTETHGKDDAEEEEEEEEGEGEEESSRRRGRKSSIIWSFFTVVDQTLLECNECGASVARPAGGCTSGALSHLRIHHPESLPSDVGDVVESPREGQDYDDGEQDYYVAEDFAEPERKGRGGPRRSVIWSHFTEVSSTHAQCNECGQLLARSVGGSTSGCLNHLKKLHPHRLRGGGGWAAAAETEEGGMKSEPKVEMEVKDSWDGLEDAEAMGEGAPVRRRRKKKRTSVVWRLFTQVDDCHLSCNVCGHQLYRGPGGSTSNALLHAKNHHPNEMEEAYSSYGTQEEEEAEDNDGGGYWDAGAADFTEYPPSYKKRKRKRTSIVWSFFDVQDGHNIACNLCEYVSYQGPAGSTSNALLHLKRHHPEAFQEGVNNDEGSEVQRKGPEEEDGDNDQGEQKPPSGQRAVIWRFFTKKTLSNAECSDCKADVPTKKGNTTGLIQHLRRNHDELYEEWREAKAQDQGATAAAAAAALGTGGEEWPEEDARAWVWKEKRSIIYSFFEQVNRVQMKCNRCDKLLVRGPGGSTSGCLNHLKRFHPEDIPADFGSGGSSVPFVPAEEREDAELHFEALCGEGQVKCRECGECLDLVALAAAVAEEGRGGPPPTKQELLYAHLRSSHPSVAAKVKRPKKNYYVRKKDRVGPGAEVAAIARRVNRSLVWDYFDRTEEGNMASCRSCRKVMEMRKQSTTSMRNHLRAHHKDDYQEFLAKELMRAQEMEAFVDSQEVKEGDEGFPGKEEGEEGDGATPRKRGRKRVFKDDPEDRTCPDCHKVYSCRPAMLYHRKVVHSGVRPFKCEKCGMTFARADSFRSHSSACGKEGKEGGGGESGAFLCSICGKTFARKGVRNVHERAHHGERRYGCSRCPKRFGTRQQLDNHERVHTGEKPFQCTECGRSFAQKHQLVTHLRIHTGEMPYTCPRCGKRFRHLSTRNKHRCEDRSHLQSSL